MLYLCTKQELAEQFINTMDTVKHGEKFYVLSFKDRPNGTSEKVPEFQPYAVQREPDGEVFTIGDTVTNGQYYQNMLCKGKITGFSLLNGTMFVEHDWNGVGWSLDSLTTVIELPSAHQVGDRVKVFLMPEGEKEFPGFTANVLAVHFYSGKVRYDLEIKFYGEISTRIYNIDSILVSKENLVSSTQ